MADGKTIGFYGDSFCADKDDQSWTNLLANKLNAKIINRGKQGHSIWTAILDYIQNPTATYSIFCWTSPHRLYHPSYPANVHSKSGNDFFDNAVKSYFLYLWNEQKEILNYKWTIEYFNEKILKESKSKIIQCNCFSNKDYGSDILINFNAGKVFHLPLLEFSGLTLQDHIQKTPGLINHMSIEKNINLSEEMFSLTNA